MLIEWLMSHKALVFFGLSFFACLIKLCLLVSSLRGGDDQGKEDILGFGFLSGWSCLSAIASYFGLGFWSALIVGGLLALVCFMVIEKRLQWASPKT
ncbi:MAG: hypothetical protein HZA81_02845 [Candidatus Taylorbacteria bacterium]|nr:hypothetical protein [Candidatus Taylorbacteria bacterium]